MKAKLCDLCGSSEKCKRYQITLSIESIIELVIVLRCVECKPIPDGKEILEVEAYE
jgi:hypothetical protein